MAEEEEKQEQPNGSGKKLIIVTAFIVLILLLGAAIGYKKFVLEKAEVKNAEEQAQKVIEEIKATEKVGVMFDLGTFIVNLADKDIERYLKVSIVIELKDQKIQQEAQERLPEVKDAITTLLLMKRAEELRTPEGIEFLKEEITKRINAILPLGGVKNVYFTDFIVQTG